ncbi:MAG TPA: 3-oxo-tetronate 4-phosphate decarboxylase [Caldimonas sp.]|nr:3-oxo-tetronate 4-phosphate decarboxylase [Caldimonas sp.]
MRRGRSRRNRSLNHNCNRNCNCNHNQDHDYSRSRSRSRNGSQQPETCCMSDARVREKLCLLGRSLFERGLTHGRTGNISVRTDRGFLMTPTGASLGGLDPARLSLLDGDGAHVGGDVPTKEALLHLAMYRARSGDGAVLHLHSGHAVAVSVLADVDPANAIPPLTAYQAMRVGTLPLLPYFAPGDPALAGIVGVAARKHHALLLSNHGPIVSGSTLVVAADVVEELEATARLWLQVRHEPVRCLTPGQLTELAERYPRN